MPMKTLAWFVVLAALLLAAVGHVILMIEDRLLGILSLSDGQWVVAVIMASILGALLGSGLWCMLWLVADVSTDELP